MANPPIANLSGTKQYRIVASRFPPINVFERFNEPEDLELAYRIEGLTNDRLLAEVGDLYRVEAADWMTGSGASVVMAPFTHIGRASRFSDGSFGVYYAGLDEDTAIAEVRFHHERFLRESEHDPIETEMRLYVGTIKRPLLDIRSKGYARYRNQDLTTYPRCQAFGAKHRETGSWGLLYRSARRGDGSCVGAYRPPAVSLPVQARHYRFVYDGDSITDVLTIARKAL